jgi:hypothetical protein
MRARWPWICATVLCCSFLVPEALCANGGVHKEISLQASFAFGDSASGQCEMRCDIAPVLYSLTTLNGKYRVLQITVHNRGTTPLSMSKSGDALSMVYEGEHGRQVKAVLDLAASDAQLWSKLSPQMRKDLAYPTTIEGREEETAFAFVPLAAPATPPDALRYTVASVPGRVIELRAPGTTKD